MDGLRIQNADPSPDYNKTEYSEPISQSWKLGIRQRQVT